MHGGKWVANVIVKHSCWQQLLDLCRWSAALLGRFSVCSSYTVCPAASLAAIWCVMMTGYKRLLTVMAAGACAAVQPLV